MLYGKKEHPEAIGLMGQTKNKAMMVSSSDEIKQADLPFKVRLFAQTTMGSKDYEKIQEAVLARLNALHPDKNIDFKSYWTICGQVSGREKKIRRFSSEHELILFVAGKDSSNGSQLFEISRESNPRSYYISKSDEVDRRWFDGVTDVGITGATSTPAWLLEEVGKTVENI